MNSRTAPLPPVHFSHRVVVAVPPAFHGQVKAAADRAGLTVADYARVSLAQRMAQDGMPFMRLPHLSSKPVGANR